LVPFYIFCDLLDIASVVVDKVVQIWIVSESYRNSVEFLVF